MTRTSLILSAAAVLVASLASPPARAQAPCTLLTPDEINTVITSPVAPGQPSTAADAKECTWKDPKGQDRVFISLKDAKDWKSFRDSMQATGRLVPVTGVAEDAFFVGSSGTSAAFYTLKKHTVVLITVDGPGFTKAQNEAAEKALAPHFLQRL